MAAGVFISLEGIDGAGKSSQVRALAEWLRQTGRDVLTCADPGGTTVGSSLRAILLDHRQHLTLASEAMLFMASRSQLVHEIIRPALAKGQVVISDRFLLSNVVYQGHGSGLDPEQLWQLGLFAIDGLEPDLICVLDLPLEVAMTRRKGDADRFERRDAAYYARLREGYRIEAERRPGQIAMIDASQSPETVQENIRREVQRVLEAHPRA